MNSQLNKKQRINKYLDKNPIDDSSKNKYEELRKKFSLDVKQASRYWIEYKQEKNINDRFPETNLTETEVKRILKQEGDNLSIAVNTDSEVKTLEDLLRICEVDPKIWEVVSWQCKKWDLGIKNAANSIETKKLFSISAKFRAIKLEENLPLQKEVILKSLLKHSVQVPQITYNKSSDSDNLLEIALFDVHFGKLAHSEEVGEDYDLRIATKRYLNAVIDLVSRVDQSKVERILLPVGQDLINIDNIQGTTTAGTAQDTDSRFHKIIKTVKGVLLTTVEILQRIAPVDIVISVGNHDEQTTFMIGEMLEAYYHNNPNVNVFNNASLRKYYAYGNTAIMLTHGNKEKFNELGMIFAAENPKVWANSLYRFIQIGHFHHNKKVTTIQSQEFQGFQVQILPSISGSDAWHTGKGYKSLKQAKAFLYNKKQGLVGEFTHNVI